MTTYNNKKVSDADANRDPITGEPGAHPVGTGIGAAAGAAAGVAGAAAIGAAYGSALGPAGTVAGAAIGGIVGGLVGKDVAEDFNPTVEEAYWRDNFNSRPYATGSDFNAYQPAYRQGYESFGKYKGQKFEEIEPKLSQDWTTSRGDSSLAWDQAKPAARDAYDRLANRPKNA